jgi:EAL and modified HD-GYP domain-containing signal transduction protein
VTSTGAFRWREIPQDALGCATMSDVFVARQAIFDRDLNVVGYELLYRRAAEDDRAVFDDADRVSYQVVLSSFLDIGLDQIVGETPAFLNLTRGFFLASGNVPFPKDRVVLELLEDVKVDALLIEKLQGYTRQGYRLALDDFVYRPELEPLLELADIVKLDVLAHDLDGLERQVDLLRPFDVMLLAEKVETPEQYDRCADLGFDFFQGFFLCRPKVLRGQQVPANRLSILRLLAKLQDPQVELDVLDRIIREDLSLSYKLLRLINSAFYGMSTRIESIRQTLVLLGLQRIRAWVGLLTLAGLEDKPHELVLASMVRAKMCERLAELMGRPAADVYFTVGMFSMLDALLDLPMTEVLESLPLSEDIQSALLDHVGPLGEVLECVVAYERGQWDRVAGSGLPAGRIRDAYLGALDWARRASEELGLAPLAASA